MQDELKKSLFLIQETWASNGGGYVFLCKNTNNKWVEEPIYWSNYSRLKEFAQDEVSDLYFTPLCFSSQSNRRSENVRNTKGCLFIDMDRQGVEWRNGSNNSPEPTFVWQTSGNRWQAIWLLNELISIDEQQIMNRRLAYHWKADTGAWDSARVLRIPNSYNIKRGGEQGKILSYQPNRAYTFAEFSNVPELESPFFSGTTDDMPDSLEEDRSSLLNKYQSDIGLEAGYWLSIDTEEYNRRGSIDRSQLIHTVIVKLLRRGLPSSIIFYLIEPTPWNKFSSRPTTLWKEIQKAERKIQE